MGSDITWRESRANFFVLFLLEHYSKYYKTIYFVQKSNSKSLENNEFTTDDECNPSLELKLNFLERLKETLTLTSTRNCQETQEMKKKLESIEEAEVCEETQPTVFEASATVVTYTDTEIVVFKESMVSDNAKKSTNTSIHRLYSCLTMKKNMATS